MTTAYCYQQFDKAALVGPLFAHRTGDIVVLPDRKHPLLGHDIPGDEWRVHRIEPDGAAFCRRVSEEEE